MILYLHGFASSSQSQKVKNLKDFPEVAIISFDLNVNPKIAIEQISSYILEHNGEDIMLMGSSLGGYYALHIAGLFDLPMVLINPSMRPYETLSRFVGVAQKNYSKDETIVYKKEYIETLKSLTTDKINQSKVLLMLQTGDESLDYRIAVKLLPNAQQSIQEGGNHSYEGFEKSFPMIEAFYKQFFKS